MDLILVGLLLALAFLAGWQCCRWQCRTEINHVYDATYKKCSAMIENTTSINEKAREYCNKAHEIVTELERRASSKG